MLGTIKYTSIWEIPCKDKLMKDDQLEGIWKQVMKTKYIAPFYVEDWKKVRIKPTTSTYVTK